MHSDFRFSRARGLAALLAAAAIAGPAFSADIQARYHTSDDTLLRMQTRLAWRPRAAA